MGIVKCILLGVVLLSNQCFCAPVEGQNSDYNAMSDSLFTPSLDIYNLLNVQSLQIKFLSDRIAELQDKPRTVYAREVYTIGGAYAELSEAGGACNATLRDCLELYQNGCHNDGVYRIDPASNGHAVRAFCDMLNNGGGWTLVQRRIDDSVNFFRNRHEYERGFGNLNGNHWIGLQHIFDLTNSENNEISELYIHLEDFQSDTRFAKYSNFSISDYKDNYRLRVSGYYGTAGDSLTNTHNGKQFTTYDFDVDTKGTNCAIERKGAWWFQGCDASHLNGVYLHGDKGSYAVVWDSWRGSTYSLKTTVMKVRRHTTHTLV